MGFWYTYGCLSSLVGIAIGAAGGHKKEWDAERKEVFHKATFYHFMNNVGILVGSLITPQAAISPYCFFLGSLIFSGCLFHRAFTDSKEYSGKYTPFGGMLMMLGWALLAFRR